MYSPIGIHTIFPYILYISQDKFKKFNVQQTLGNGCNFQSLSYRTHCLRVVDVLAFCDSNINKYHQPTIMFKSHTLGLLDYPCPLCRSSQLFINLHLLLNCQLLFNYPICIFHPDNQLIMWIRTCCLVLPKCQDYTFFLCSKQDHVMTYF